MSNLYRQLYVFERIDPENAVRYVCYEDLETGKFSVSVGECLKLPADDRSTGWFLTQQIDHFIAEGCERWFDTLKEAVEDYSPVMGAHHGRR